MEEFKAEFQKGNDRDLLREIEGRTQAKDESIGIYLAVMNRYFSRLQRPFGEKEKISILLRNVRPNLQRGIGIRDIETIAELRTICRKLEMRDKNIDQFHEPTPRRAQTLEPDLAYIVDASEALDTVGPINRPGGSNLPSSSREFVCYRCNQPGHKAIGCLLPGKRFCYKCKKEGFTVRTCPVCRRSGNAEQRP